MDGSIVGFKEENVGREEGEDGFLNFIFHCTRSYDAAFGRLCQLKGFKSMRLLQRMTFSFRIRL